MSVFDLKGSSGSGNNWNYSRPNEAGYMECIEGTVVEVSNPQSINYATKQPETWSDGNPKRNLCLVIKGRSGQELAWIFSPKSRASEACTMALDPQNAKEHVSIEEILGKMIRVQTQAGSYNSVNPRPWWVTILGDGDVQAVRGVVDLSKQQAPVMQKQASAPLIQMAQHIQQETQQQAPAPQIQQAQQQAAQALGYAPQPAPPVQQYQQPAPPVQQQPAPLVNQVPYAQDPTGGYYDQDIPF